MDNVNITIDDGKWSSVFPSGFYKWNLKFTDPKTEILNVEFVVEVKSEIKTSF